MTAYIKQEDSKCICLLEVRGLVVAVQQSLMECRYLDLLTSMCSDNIENLQRSTVERTPKQYPHLHCRLYSEIVNESENSSPMIPSPW